MTQPTLEQLLAEVCELFNQDIEVVKSERKKKEEVAARRIFCYAAWRYTGYSVDSIGEAIGGRDHTTVCYQLNKARAYIDSKDELFKTQWEFYLENSKLLSELKVTRSRRYVRDKSK